MLASKLLGLILVRVPDILTVLTLGLPAYAGFEICRRWLQAQGLMHVPTLALVVAAPLNIALNWLLAWGP